MLSEIDLLSKGVIEEFLYTDICHTGEASLPAVAPETEKQKAVWKGLFVLQIVEMIDIGKPPRGDEAAQENASGPRCLRIIFTDGYREITGMEYRKVHCFSSETKLGAKVVVKDPDVRMGYMLLTNSNTKLLGGLVDAPEEEKNEQVAGASSMLANTKKKRKRKHINIVAQKKRRLEGALPQPAGEQCGSRTLGPAPPRRRPVPEAQKIGPRPAPKISKFGKKIFGKLAKNCPKPKPSAPSTFHVPKPLPCAPSTFHAPKPHPSAPSTFLASKPYSPSLFTNPKRSAPSVPNVLKACAPSGFDAQKPCSPNTLLAPPTKPLEGRPMTLGQFSKHKKAKQGSVSLQPSKTQLHNDTKPCLSPFNCVPALKVRQSAPFGGSSKPVQFSKRPGPAKLKPLFKPSKSVPPKLPPLLVTKPVHRSFTKPANALSSNHMPSSKSVNPPQFSKSPIINPSFGRSRAKPVLEKANKKCSIVESTTKLVFRKSPSCSLKKMKSKSLLPTGPSVCKPPSSYKLEKPTLPSNMRFGKLPSCGLKPVQESFFCKKDKNGFDTSSKVKHDTFELEDPEEEPCSLLFGDDEDMGLFDFI